MLTFFSQLGVRKQLVGISGLGNNVFDLQLRDLHLRHDSCQVSNDCFLHALVLHQATFPKDSQELTKLITSYYPLSNLRLCRSQYTQAKKNTAPLFLCRIYFFHICSVTRCLQKMLLVFKMFLGNMAKKQPTPRKKTTIQCQILTLWANINLRELVVIIQGIIIKNSFVLNQWLVFHYHHLLYSFFSLLL